MHAILSVISILLPLDSLIVRTIVESQTLLKKILPSKLAIVGSVWSIAPHTRFPANSVPPTVAVACRCCWAIPNTDDIAISKQKNMQIGWDWVNLWWLSVIWYIIVGTVAKLYLFLLLYVSMESDWVAWQYYTRMVKCYYTVSVTYLLLVIINYVIALKLEIISNKSKM